MENGAEEEKTKGNNDLSEYEEPGIHLQELLFIYEQRQLVIENLNGKRLSSEYVKKVDDNSDGVDSIKMASLEVIENTGSQDSLDLLRYFSFLGEPDNRDDIDFIHIDKLISSSDINSKDNYGQSVMHEIAREWSPDVAFFLKCRGAKIDQEDTWGRTPLFVAVASNHIKMVTWLIENGANINHRTKGDKQLPIHFAAKYGAIESFDLLMKHGAKPTEKDGEDRDPLFLAAQHGNAAICKHMLELELPTACYAKNGEAAIDHIVENLSPEIAEKALDQFYNLNKSTGYAKLYLGCLCKRRYMALNANKNLLGKRVPPNPLEIITKKEILKLAKHPVILKLIKLKYEKVGKPLIRLNIVLHFVLTILWTVSVSIRFPLPNEETGKTFHSTHSTNMKIILWLTIAAQPVTILFIRKLWGEYSSLVRITKDEQKRLLKQYTSSLKYVHPRWPKEIKHVKKIERKAKTTQDKFWYSGWSLLEALCLVMTCVQTFLTIYWYIDTKHVRVLTKVRMYHSVFFVIVIWTRLNRAFRSDRSLGPFVAMLAESGKCMFKVMFLFFEFFIPFTVLCWVIFGGEQKVNGQSVISDYQYFHTLVYQLYLLSINSDYDFDSLKKIDLMTAMVFVAIYFLLLSVITLNIYTAFLSEMAQRVLATANERADIEESDSCGKIERGFPLKKDEFEVYLVKHCSPLKDLTDIAEYKRLIRKISPVASNAFTKQDQIMAMQSGKELIKAVEKAKHVVSELSSISSISCFDKEKCLCLENKLLILNTNCQEVKFSDLTTRPVLNVRSVVIQASMNLRNVRSIVSEIIEDQKLSKREIRSAEEKITFLKEHLEKRRVESILKKVSFVMNNQSVPAIRLGKTIEDRFVDYMTNIKGAYENYKLRP